MNIPCSKEGRNVISKSLFYYDVIPKKLQLDIHPTEELVRASKKTRRRTGMGEIDTHGMMQVPLSIGTSNFPSEYLAHYQNNTRKGNACRHNKTMQLERTGLRAQGPQAKRN
jgi:hypothetical protein